MKSVLSVLSLSLVAGIAFAERQPYARYESIVERQMFGDPPEGFDPTKPPSEAVSVRAAQKVEQQLSKDQEKLKSAIHFSMINVTPSGETAVGFTDSSDSKAPRNYYLKVGEGRDGWTVKTADASAGTMTIAKGDVEVSLTIGDNSAKGAGKISAVGGRDRSSARTGVAGSLNEKRNLRLSQQREQQAKMEDLIKGMREREEAEARRRDEERQAREEEKAKQEADREEQRTQLLKLQEELRRAREDRKKPDEEKADSDDAQSQDQNQ